MPEIKSSILHSKHTLRLGAFQWQSKRRRPSICLCNFPFFSLSTAAPSMFYGEVERLCWFHLSPNSEKSKIQNLILGFILHVCQWGTLLTPTKKHFYNIYFTLHGSWWFVERCLRFPWQRYLRTACTQPYCQVKICSRNRLRGSDCLATALCMALFR